MTTCIMYIVTRQCNNSKPKISLEVLTMEYFKNCKTTQDVKKEFRKLTKANHPDTFQCITEKEKANERMIKIIEQYEKALKSATYEKIDNSAYANMNDEDFAVYVSKEMQEVINNISHLPITIEIVGTWLWISGEHVHDYKAYLTAH